MSEQPQPPTVDGPDYGGQTIDLTLLDGPALNDLRVRVLTEQENRSVIADAGAQADLISTRYLRARDQPKNVGGAPVEPRMTPAWVQPTGGHDAYPNAYRVSHGGKLWYSLTSANVWEPGVSGWREFVPEPTDGSDPTYPDWMQPTGAHDAYKAGDRVTFAGEVYESVINVNVYSPEAYPAGWQVVTFTDPEPDPEPDPGPVGDPYPEWTATGDYITGDRVMYEGRGYESLIDGNTTVPVAGAEWRILAGYTEPTPEPPPAPTYPAWKQPTGGHDAYNVGDRVTFEGKVYESKIAGNTWSPTGYPAGWQLIP